MLDMNLWRLTNEFHGHECPGIALGFKFVEGAVDVLGIQGELPTAVEGLTCVTTTQKCPVDAVRCLLGLTEESGTLGFELSEEMAFTFTAADGRTVRLVTKPHTFGGRRGQEAIEWILSVPYTALLDVL